MDGLLNWLSREDAIECGQDAGATVIDPETGEVKTTVRLETPFGVVNLSLIGQHSYVSDLQPVEDSTLENHSIGTITTVPGWWYLFRAPNGFPIGKMRSSMTKPPTVVWHSEMVDEETGVLIPRPPIEEAPQRRWA